VGFPVGPITLMDEVGIDVGAKVLKVMGQYYGDRMDLPDVSVIDSFLAEDRRGRKSGKGFYLYEKGESVTRGGKKVVDPDVLKRLPPATAKPDLGAVADRLRLALVNEAAWCLHEGILREPRAGDLGAVMGIGFPPFEGGPFRYCDKVGITKIVAQMRALEAVHGHRFAPCPLLVRRAEANEPFYGV
jgi:3-hydroxyacyl-CoA dehydrogenase/enoyl-CoA hydratase/3-hydroxybutyryl-CoA epimerase